MSLSMNAQPIHWPTEIRLKDRGRALVVTFDDGARFDLAAEYLRVSSPSAEVRGHSAGERKTVAGKREIAILKVDPVGNYAVRLTFDDMHDTGIYSWAYLRELGANEDQKWADYLADLDAKGLTRNRT